MNASLSDDRRIPLTNHRVIIAGTLQLSTTNQAKCSPKYNMVAAGVLNHTLSLSENVFHVASENINFRPPEPAVECSKQVIPEFPGVLPFLVLPLCRSARLRRYVAGWPYVRTLAPQGNNPLTVRMPMRKLKFSHNSIKSGKNKTFCRTKIAPLHGLQFCRTK